MTGQPLLLDGPAIAHELGIDPALLRQWASRGHITRRGRDSARRMRFDFDEVEGEARRRGLLDPGA